MIQVNQTKAEEITKEKIRQVRDPLLAKQDVEFQKALELGTDTTAIVAEKQRLRDATNVATGKTVDELKAIIADVEANGV